jgi:hypothetical protein
MKIKEVFKMEIMIEKKDIRYIDGDLLYGDGALITIYLNDENKVELCVDEKILAYLEQAINEARRVLNKRQQFK